MKKIITLILLTLTVNIFSQSGASTAKLQSAGNATAVALLNKIDTTTKVFIKSFTVAVASYSAANVAMLGSTSSSSWSLDLGSQYWQMIDAKVMDLGNNYAYSANILILNDTLTLTENVAPTYTQARARKIIGALTVGSQTNLNWTSGRINVMNNLATTNISQSLGVFRGVIYFYHFANGVHGLANQVINTRIAFRKLKN